VQLRRARNEMMLLDVLFTLFLTHVGNLTTVKSNQRRFAPTPAHIEWNHLPTSPEYALLITHNLVSQIQLLGLDSAK